MKNSFDSIIVGGGLVGSSIAMGLASRGKSVAVIDGGDHDHRASRGNFGLTWIQGKGANHAGYGNLSLLAGNLWSKFNEEIERETGIRTGFEQSGGMDFCLTESEWADRLTEMRSMRRHCGDCFRYEMLEHSELKKMVPQISGKVLGASYSPHDGHINPLYLLRALHTSMMMRGCCYYPNTTVDKIIADEGEFLLKTSETHLSSSRIILCAGLDNQRLANDLGMSIPVSPLKGQLLITERVAPFLKYPSIQVRQTSEGTLQLGDSHEQTGLDDSVSVRMMIEIADRAVRIFPLIHNVQLKRAWGALRIMTPDGLPVYHQSCDYPGAFAISCHSGVTLAVIHAGIVANWISGESPDPLIEKFSADRFRQI